MQNDSVEAFNPRGIPKAVFLEQVEDYIGGADQNADLPLKTLQETLAKYRFMESNSLRRQHGLDEKIPELERTMDMVALLRQKNEKGESFEASFELSNTLYALGVVDEVKEVYIWLGANTMLSYSLISASSLLAAKLDTARVSALNVKEDLDWLRDQITVTEVNVARVYNWDIKRRRQQKESSTEQRNGPESEER